MGESHNNHHRPTPSSAASRLGLGIRTSSSTASEIVEARGHILRATGRKDRHSKVCTAKGPRDRRVRLAAHTAIQFYDVQDRLGYDRPSKAVDWLIKKAKAAIDELEELPPWNPSAQTSSPPVVPISATQDTQNASHHHRFSMVEAPVSSPGNRRTEMVGSGVAELVNHNSSNFLPPSMDSDSIADTIKSFFPMGAATAAETPSFHHSYPPDLLSRTSSQSQDLRLSLHPFQDSILLHHHNQAHHHHHHQNEQAFLSGTANPLGFDGSSATWTEHHQQHQQQAELNRLQRIMTWNNAGADSNNNSGAGAGGFTFNSLPLTQTQTQTQSPTLQPFLFGQNQFFSSQRGPLQSSNTPSIHAWIDHNDPSSISDHHHHQMAPSIHHQSSISGLGFASGGFPGFHIPARIQGEEEHDGISDKPSSASSNSRH